MCSCWLDWFARPENRAKDGTIIAQPEPVEDPDDLPPRKDVEGSGIQLWYPKANIYSPSLKVLGEYSYNYPRGAIIQSSGGRPDVSTTMDWYYKQGINSWGIGAQGNVFQSCSLKYYGKHVSNKSQYPGIGNGNAISAQLLGITVACAGVLEKFGNDYKSWFDTIHKADEVRIVTERNENIYPGVYHKYTESEENTLIDILIWLKHNNPKIFNFDLVLGYDEISTFYNGEQISEQIRFTPGGSLSKTMPKLRKYLKEKYKKLYPDG